MRRRLTRTDQVRSRKWRRSSPTMVGTAKVAKRTRNVGSKRSTALTRARLATCRRSSGDSPRPLKRRAQCRASQRCSSIELVAERGSEVRRSSPNRSCSISLSSGIRGLDLTLRVGLRAGARVARPPAFAGTLGQEKVNQTDLLRSSTGSLPQPAASWSTIRRPRPLVSSGVGCRTSGGWSASSSMTVHPHALVLHVHDDLERGGRVAHRVGDELAHEEEDGVGVAVVALVLQGVRDELSAPPGRSPALARIVARARCGERYR